MAKTVTVQLEVHPVYAEILKRLAEDHVTPNQVVSLADLMWQRAHWTGSYGLTITEDEYNQASRLMLKAAQKVEMDKDWFERRGY